MDYTKITQMCAGVEYMMKAAVAYEGLMKFKNGEEEGYHQDCIKSLIHSDVDELYRLVQYGERTLINEVFLIRRDAAAAEGGLGRTRVILSIGDRDPIVSGVNMSIPNIQAAIKTLFAIVIFIYINLL